MKEAGVRAEDDSSDEEGATARVLKKVCLFEPDLIN